MNPCHLCFIAKGSRHLGKTLRRALLALLLTAVSIPPLAAEVKADRVALGGYLRVMTRPDFQGGDSRLGFWNLYGRLLNEGPYATLDLRVDLLDRDPITPTPWAKAHLRFEGGSVFDVDSRAGGLDAYRLSQLYLEAGNLLLDRVVWRVGTLEDDFCDLGLYDMRLSQLLDYTVGASLR